MNYTIVLGIAALIFLVIGIVIGKIGSNKGLPGFVVTGFLIGFVGVICGYCCYDNYMEESNNYSITAMREVDDGYQLTLSSDTKGFTGGKIVITDSEAISLKLVTLDEEGNYIWEGGAINESRKWINEHRNST